MALTSYPAAGEDLTATILQALISELRPLYAEKTADETVNNSAVLQDDNELVLAVSANTKWEVTALIRYNSGTTPDIKVKYTVPTSATMKWAVFAAGSGVFLGYQQDETTTAIIDGAGTGVACLVKGILTVGANAGNLTMQWAQNVATVANTIVQAGSYLLLRRMS